MSLSSLEKFLALAAVARELSRQKSADEHRRG